MHLSESIPFTEIPDSSRLFLDYISQSKELAGFYESYPSESAYPTLYKKLQAINYPRQELVDILLRQNQQFGASEQTLENIKLLENPETVAVVTGQQVGLFGGPLYTIYKTLTALQIAQSLKDKSSISAIPIFWMAADDDDFTEINHIAILDKSNQVAKLEYIPQKAIANKSANSIIFGDKINELIAQIESSLFDTEFKPQIFTNIRECYQPGTSFSVAFGKWMTILFNKYGLVLIDPTDTQVRILANQLYKKEIAEQAKSKEVVQTTTIALCEKGYHQQVAVQEDKTNLFIDYAGSRYPIRKKKTAISFPEPICDIRLKS